MEKAVKGIDVIFHVAAPHASHPRKVRARTIDIAGQQLKARSGQPLEVVWVRVPVSSRSIPIMTFSRGTLPLSTHLPPGWRTIAMLTPPVCPVVVDQQVQYDVNVVGTGNLLEAAAKAGVKSFVFTSSARWVVKDYISYLHKVLYSGSRVLLQLGSTQKGSKGGVLELLEAIGASEKCP